MSKIEEFNKISNDADKFKWLMKNQDLGLCLTLDNDDMYLVDTRNEDAELGRFESWIGNAPGIMSLLEAIGIQSDFC